MSKRNHDRCIRRPERILFTVAFWISQDRATHIGLITVLSQRRRCDSRQSVCIPSIARAALARSSDASRVHARVRIACVRVQARARVRVCVCVCVCVRACVRARARVCVSLFFR